MPFENGGDTDNDLQDRKGRHSHFMLLVFLEGFWGRVQNKFYSSDMSVTRSVLWLKTLIQSLRQFQSSTQTVKNNWEQDRVTLAVRINPRNRPSNGRRERREDGGMGVPS